MINSKVINKWDYLKRFGCTEDKAVAAIVPSLCNSVATNVSGGREFQSPKKDFLHIRCTCSLVGLADVLPILVEHVVNYDQVSSILN